MEVSRRQSSRQPTIQPTMVTSPATSQYLRPLTPSSTTPMRKARGSGTQHGTVSSEYTTINWTKQKTSPPETAKTRKTSRARSQNDTMQTPSPRTTRPSHSSSSGRWLKPSSLTKKRPRRKRWRTKAHTHNPPQQQQAHGKLQRTCNRAVGQRVPQHQHSHDVAMQTSEYPALEDALQLDG